MTLSPLKEVTSHSTFIGFLSGGLVDRSTDSSGIRTVFSAGVPADIVPAGAGPGSGAGSGSGPSAGPVCLDVLRFDISDKKNKQASKKVKKTKNIKKQAAPWRFVGVELSVGNDVWLFFSLAFPQGFYT